MQMDKKMDKPSEKFISRLQAYPNLSCFLHFTALTKQDENNKNCYTDRFQNLEQIAFQ